MYERNGEMCEAHVTKADRFNIIDFHVKYVLSTVSWKLCFADLLFLFTVTALVPTVHIWYHYDIRDFCRKNSCTSCRGLCLRSWHLIIISSSFIFVATNRKIPLRSTICYTLKSNRLNIKIKSLKDLCRIKMQCVVK